MTTEQLVDQRNKQWKDKEVLIKGSHPHSGERGTVLCAEFLASLQRTAIKVKGDNGENFYVLNMDHIVETAEV